MFVRCFCELNVCLDEYELFARPRVAGHYTNFINPVTVEGVLSLFSVQNCYLLNL